MKDIFIKKVLGGGFSEQPECEILGPLVYPFFLNLWFNRLVTEVLQFELNDQILLFFILVMSYFIFLKRRNRNK